MPTESHTIQHTYRPLKNKMKHRCVHAQTTPLSHPISTRSAVQRQYMNLKIRVHSSVQMRMEANYISEMLFAHLVKWDWASQFWHISAWKYHSGLDNKLMRTNHWWRFINWASFSRIISCAFNSAFTFYLSKPAGVYCDALKVLQSKINGLVTYVAL